MGRVRGRPRHDQGRKPMIAAATVAHHTGAPSRAWTRRKLIATAGVASAAVACAPAAGTAQNVGSTADAPAKLLVKIRAGVTYEQAFKEGITLFNQKFPKTTVEY